MLLRELYEWGTISGIFLFLLTRRYAYVCCETRSSYRSALVRWFVSFGNSKTWWAWQELRVKALDPVSRQTSWRAKLASLHSWVFIYFVLLSGVDNLLCVASFVSPPRAPSFRTLHHVPPVCTLVCTQNIQYLNSKKLKWRFLECLMESIWFHDHMRLLYMF